MRLSRVRPVSLPIPLAVSWVLVYAGFAFLLVYYLKVWIPRMLLGLSPGPVRFAMWLTGGGAAYLSWLSCLLGVLVVTFLWIRWRAERADSFVIIPYLVASLAVLLVHWSLAQTIGRIPVYLLETI